MDNSGQLGFIRTFLGSILLFAVGPSIAHHSFATHYMMDELAQVTGSVTRVRLANPHSFFSLEIETADGETEQWDVEANSIPLLRRAGISPDSIAIGERMTFVGFRSRDPSKLVMFGLEAMRENGAKLFLGEEDLVAPSSIAFVRGIPSERQSLSEFVGVWERRYSADERINQEGDSPLPLNAAGLAARADYDPLNTPAMECIPPNLPSVFFLPYLMAVNLDGDRPLIRYEYQRLERELPLVEPEQVVSGLAQFGHSSAQFEDGVLLVETSGFPELRAGLASDWDANGLGMDIPSSTQKRVREEYTLSDDGRFLRLFYEVHDPVYLSEPYRREMHWERAPEGTTFVDFECDPAIASESTLHAVPDRP